MAGKKVAAKKLQLRKRTAHLTKSFATRGHLKYSLYDGDPAYFTFRETARSEELKLFDPTIDSPHSIADGKYNPNMAVGIEFSVGRETERCSYLRVFLTASDVVNLVKSALKKGK